MMGIKRIGIGMGLAAAALTMNHDAQANQFKVEITNNAPAGGVYITPVWVGFHDGSFDSYDGGLSAQEGLERIAEDGSTAALSADFNNGLTYIDNSGMTPASAVVVSTQNGADRVDGTIGGAPIAPGATVSQTFDVTSGSNAYFSYASMILPSSDYFIANGNPLAHDLSALFGAPLGTSITFNIGLPGSINDAGTEVDDWATSAANGLFPQLNLPAGQGGPNQGADQNGVVANVINPFVSFLNPPTGLDTNPDFSPLQFNNASLYGNGVATVTITAVPEPASAGLLAVGGLLVMRRRVKR